jgi:hypothetical protein
MTIKLEIMGDHATDVIGEIKLLAEAFGVEKPVEPKQVTPKPQVETVTEQEQNTETEEPETSNDTEQEQVEEEKPKKVRKWGAVKQGKAIDEMVEKGEIIEEHLPYMSDKNIEKAKEKIAAKLEAIDKSGDDEITLDDLRQLGNERGKDEDGNQVPSKMVEIRKIITKHVPDGQDIKMSNVAEDKIAEAYQEIKAL